MNRGILHGAWENYVTLAQEVEYLEVLSRSEGVEYEYGAIQRHLRVAREAVSDAGDLAVYVAVVEEE